MKQTSVSKYRKTFVSIVLALALFACNFLSPSPSQGNGSETLPTSTTGAKNSPTQPAKPASGSGASLTPTPTATDVNLPAPDAKFTLEIETHSLSTDSDLTRTTEYFMSIPLEKSAGGMLGQGKAIMKMTDTGWCVGEATFEVTLNVTATGTDPITFTGDGSQTVISNEEVCGGVKTVPATGTSPVGFAPVELPARDGATKTIHIPLGANGDFSQTYTLRIK